MRHLFCILIGGLLIGSAQADTRTVTSLADSGATLAISGVNGPVPLPWTSPTSPVAGWTGFMKSISNPGIRAPDGCS